MSSDSKAEPTVATLPSADEPSKTPKAIVGIGASAGGLSALRAMFQAFPADSGLAFVVVIHLSPQHKSHLAELLQKNSPVKVQQIRETTPILPNHAYVIPPNAQLEAIDTHLRLAPLERKPGDRATIDHFFRTLATTHDGNSIGIILTGTGGDGSLGIKEIKEQGGLTIVQDPSDAEYEGMPRSAISTGLVDLVLPLQEIPAAVMRLANTEPNLPTKENEGEEMVPQEQQILQRLFSLVASRTNRDFSNYRISTILRRIERRMQLRGIDDLADYLTTLNEEPYEAHALAEDMLVTVTSFFRDPKVFAHLKEKVIPNIFDNRQTDEEIRVWSVGCASGEEAYTLAILFHEEAKRRDATQRIQIFASDLHERSLKRAREGFYSGDIDTIIPADQLNRHFTKVDGGYRVQKALRDMIVFTPHNLLGDPPFSRVDLISCRNMLIYIKRAIQRDIVELFHYALRTDGFLLLGTSESLASDDLFRTTSKRHCVFRKRKVAALEPRLPVFPFAQTKLSADGGWEKKSNKPIAFSELQKSLLERYSPPNVLVSPEDKATYLSDNAGAFLRHSSGEPSTNVFKLVRHELCGELRAALFRARETEELVRSKPVELPTEDKDSAMQVVISVQPATGEKLAGFVLVLFEVNMEAAESGAADKDKREPGSGAEQAASQESRSELGYTQQMLQSIVEEHEISKEGMNAANEELQSMNEELRSTLEELETSKEELQSTNEELQTMNQENQYKVQELDQLTGDLQNLLAATDIATLFLDREIRIQRFTPNIGELFNMRNIDQGRPLSDITHRIGYDKLQEDARQVVAKLISVERTVESESGKWFLTRLMPYRSVEDRIEGVVITFVDITERRNIELKIRDARIFAERIVETLPEPLMVLTFDLRIQTTNDTFHEHFKIPRAETNGRTLFDIENGCWDSPLLRSRLKSLSDETPTFRDFYTTLDFPRVGRRFLLINGRRMADTGTILLAISDITNLSKAESNLRKSVERFRALANASAYEIYCMKPDWTGIRRLDIPAGSRDGNDSSSSWLDEYILPEEQEDVEAAITKAIETRSVFELEHQKRDRSGCEGWALSRVVPILDEAGNLVEWIGAASDVTLRKLGERELSDSRAHLAQELGVMTRLHTLSTRLPALSQMSSVLEEALDASIDIMGADMGTARIVDPTTGELGLVAQRGFSDRILEKFGRVDAAHTSCCGRAYKAGTRIFIEDVREDPGFEPYRELAEEAGFVSVQSTPLRGRDGTLLGMLTTHKGAVGRPDEADLRVLDLYAQQAADYIQHVRRQEEIATENRRKDEFLATLAHELRNPMAPIRTGLELLRITREDTDQFDEIIGMMERQCGQLVTLVDDLLQVSRISQGKLKLKKKRVNLAEVVRSAFEETRPSIEEAKHELRLDLPREPTYVNGDPNRLAQVLSNLLGNAAKYTPKAGEIKLSIQRSGSTATIAVKDNGIGISADKIGKIFDLFNQIERYDENCETGLGIGLSLVRSIVELHGGTIAVHSDGEGKGCVFTVELALDEEDSLPEEENDTKETQSIPAAQVPRKRVLVADDNDNIRQMFKFYIEHQGHEVRTAKTERKLSKPRLRSGLRSYSWI
ncbi:chemotaxis protein CheB [Pelagicoccus sp. SDUM812002]|uniref:chemotaxis protein CheB n=1 Tax=Pelagicoccus sp. SDUM812002 TaxID=3041266 RepID=UPI00280CFAE8|nr:chemotaxis protein CheB [Pelagicoccus sp. SDUM812002]MDQ8184119.1 chemotaxis protein CheB [Pelagicoccus sp. SDUM812002]